MKTKFEGVVVASPTPFNKDRGIDIDAVRKMMQYYIVNEVDGVFLLSSTGEYYAMNPEKREQFVDVAINVCAGKVPLLAMISEASIDMVYRNIDIYGKKKLDALVVLPPYFFKYSQDELYEYFSSIADYSPLPIILYNQPMRLPNNIDIQLVKRLSEHQNIIGLKDTSSDAVRLLNLLNLFKDRNDFTIFAGSESLSPFASIFGGSFVYALAAVDPKLFKQIFLAGRNGDIESVNALYNEVEKLFALFHLIRGGSSESFSNFVLGIKGALNALGLCEIYGAQLGYEIENGDLESIKDILRAQSNLPDLYFS